MSTAKKRVVIASTSHNVLGVTGWPTGVWVPEVAHPLHELVSAGIEVDFASVKGGAIPLDPYSDSRNPQAQVKEDPVTLDFLTNEQQMARFNQSQKLEDVDVTKYDAIVFAGGNGAIFDLPNNPTVAKVVTAFLDHSSKKVATLCHGTAALVGVTLQGQPLVKGLEVTGFDNEEEAISYEKIKADYLPFYLEDALKKEGALFRNGPPFQPFCVVTLSGRLITGQNNFSGSLVGKELVAALQK